MLERITAHHQKMGDIVVAAQLGQIGIGLKGGPKNLAILQMVLIAVEQVDAGILLQRANIAVESVGLQNVIVIQKSDVIALAQTNGGIGI